MTLDELRIALRGLTYRQTMRLWKEAENAAPDAVRNLILVDRFYLLTRACRRKDAAHPWVFERCREVEAAPDDRLDLWAREHFKSSVITFAGSIQEILRDPEITIGIFSHTRPIANKFKRQIGLELETNGVLKAAFPDVLYANPRRESPRWNDDGIVVRRKGNQKEATLESWGLVDGQPTASHFSLRIYDDVVTRESVTTPDQVQKTTEAWELSDNLGTTPGRKWHIGTRYSYADSYSTMLKRGLLIPRIHPATDNGKMDGNPVLWTVGVWETKKLIQGPATAACQLLQNPLEGAQAFFDAGDLQQWEVRPRTLNVYILVDPARSMKKGSAHTAMAVIGVDAGRNRYLLDGYDHRMDLRTRFDKLWELFDRWRGRSGVQSIRIGYESYGAQADVDFFIEEGQRTGKVLPIEELKWPRDGEGSKDDRVQRLGPDLRNKRFYLPSDIKPDTDIMAEMRKTEPSRVAVPIRKRDSENNIYDLSERFREQVRMYPFCQLKDLIDATARIYDMEPTPPKQYRQEDLEPEVFHDS